MKTDKISYLTLGTVQLGMKYGIANKTGMPGRNEALNILSAAVIGGVNSFDTSFLYGDSEEVIGDFLEHKKERREDLFINSKMPRVEASGEDGIYDKVRGYILSSGRKLKVDVIDSYMMHNAADILSYGGGVVKGLARAKAEGLIGKIGVSVYHPEEAELILDMPEVELIQLPFNIFDARFYSSGTLEKLKSSGKTIFARSIFLQGLFFLNGRQLADRVSGAAGYVKKLTDFAEGLGIGPDELAVRFVKGFREIDSIVLGAETASQVERNIELSAMEALDDAYLKDLLRIFSDVPESVYMPTLWNSR